MGALGRPMKLGLMRSDHCRSIVTTRAELDNEEYRMGRNQHSYR